MRRSPGQRGDGPDGRSAGSDDALKSCSGDGHLTETLSSRATTVVIAANPRAGSGSAARRVDRLGSLLRGQGFEVARTVDLDELVERVGHLQRGDRLRAVVAAGGDGTVAEIVNRTPPGTPVAVLPLGTENLLAKHLGVSSDPAELAQMVERGRVVRLDAGLAGGRVFLLMLSCGFDAEVVRRVDTARTGPIRHWSYFQPIVQSIRSYQYPELRVYCDPPSQSQQSEPMRVRWVFAFNLPCYARGLKFVPADATDGLFDVCTFARGSLWHGLRYLLGVMRGTHTQMSDCWVGQAARLRIEADVEVPYQLDGDFGGVLPLEVEVVPNRLALVVPSGWRAKPEAPARRR